MENKKDRLYTFGAKVCKSSQEWGVMLIVVGFENKAFTINKTYAKACGLAMGKVYTITATIIEKNGYDNIAKIQRVH